MIKNLLLAAISLAVAFLIGEGVVRLVADVRNVGPSFSTYDSYYGKVLKKNFSAVRYTPEFTMTISTNSHGFRGPELAGEKPILFLGDSFTLGYGVSDGEEFPQLVGQALGVPVLNRGIGNAGQAHWIKFLETEAATFHPRLVVLQFLVNDYFDNAGEGQYRLVDERLVEQPIPRAGLKRSLQGFIESIPFLPYSHLISLLRELRWDVGGVGTPGDAKLPNEELTLAMVERAIELCRRLDLPHVLLITEVSGDELDRLKVLSEHTLEIPSKVKAPELYYEIDGHWNRAGHIRAANKLIEYLRKTFPDLVG